jgi:glycine betaine transporter
VGPIGFLGLQVSAGLTSLFGVPGGLGAQIGVIVALAMLYIGSALTGVGRGIQILSRFNVGLTALLLGFILLVGPTGFILSHFISGLGVYAQSFLPMAFERDGAGLFGESGWLSGWTLFFWAWFIGYGPMMAIFIARISRGRSIRSLIFTLCVLAPMATHFWFTILGGSGLAFELGEPGSVSDAFEGFDLPAALLAITANLPLSLPISVLFLVLTSVFVATTGDSMTFAISSSLSKDGEPVGAMRAFWGVIMAAMAIALVAAGGAGDAVGKLQQFIMVTAAPVSLILLPSLWAAPRLALRRWRDGQSR